MIRGDVFEAALDPVKGSEQSGQRPVVVVSRDALNEFLDTVVVVPFTTLREGRSVYPNQAIVRAPEGGLGSPLLRCVSKFVRFRVSDCCAHAGFFARQPWHRLTMPSVLHSHSIRTCGNRFR